MERSINVALALIIIGLRLVFSASRRSGGRAREAVAGPPPRQKPTRTRSTSSSANRSRTLTGFDAREGLEDRAGALGVSAIRGASGTDVNEQIKQFEDAMARKPAGIIVSPAGVGITPMINRAIDGGIVICVDRRAAKQAVQLRRHGQLQRRAARRRTAGQTARRPRCGFCSRCPASPTWKTASEVTATPWQNTLPSSFYVGNDRVDPNEAAKVARNILSAHPNIAGVGCVDAGGGEGTAVVLREKGLAGKVKIVGMDRNESHAEPDRRRRDRRRRTGTYTSLHGAECSTTCITTRCGLVDDRRGANVLPLPTTLTPGRS